MMAFDRKSDSAAAAEKIRQRQESVKRLFRLTGDELVQEVLRNFRGGDDGPPQDMRKRLSIRDDTLCGRNWYRMASKTATPLGDTEKILYLHGGGFVLETGTAQLSFSEFLCERTGAEIWFPAYPLAPESTCLDALEMVTELYRRMLQETSGEKIALMGDSAGGALAVSSAMHFNEVGLSQPNHLILISPCLDMEMPTEGPDYEYMQILSARDPMLSPIGMPTIFDLWRGNLRKTDGRANPICGKLHGLPPMVIFAGTGEIMHLPCMRFAEKARKEGADIHFVEKEGMPHIWLIFPDHDSHEERALIVDTLMHARG